LLVLKKGLYKMDRQLGLSGGFINLAKGCYFCNTLQRPVKDKPFGCAFGASLTALFRVLNLKVPTAGGRRPIFTSGEGTLERINKLFWGK